jgi:hypothetical protein
MLVGVVVLARLGLALAGVVFAPPPASTRPGGQSKRPQLLNDYSSSWCPPQGALTSSHSQIQPAIPSVIADAATTLCGTQPVVAQTAKNCHAVAINTPAHTHDIDLRHIALTR